MVKSDFKMQLKQCFALFFMAGSLLAQLPLRQDPKDVVATVDGRDVTRAEVQQILFVSGPQFAATFQANPQVALYQWFLQQHLGKEGAAMKLDQESPLKEQLEALRMQYLADARVNLEMNSYQVPRAAVEKYYAQNVTRYQRNVDHGFGGGGGGDLVRGAVATQRRSGSHAGRGYCQAPAGGRRHGQAGAAIF
jgi:hypothetical protein